MDTSELWSETIKATNQCQIGMRFVVRRKPEARGTLIAIQATCQKLANKKNAPGKRIACTLIMVIGNLNNFFTQDKTNFNNSGK